MDYKTFIESKRHTQNQYGFQSTFISDNLFDFQKYIVEKAVKKGRMGIFLDTGLGKSRISLAIAYNIVLKTNKRVLILTPLAVAFQFLKEAEAIGIEDIEHTKNGKFTKKIILCNYERLHYLNSDDFICVIADESSCIKNFMSKTKTQLISFMRKTPYRFLQTATPSPNDFIELGTSSEAIGELGYMDMLNRFFKNNENTNDSRNKNIGEKYYLKPHAEKSFFEWINSWAIMIKKPSDIGFDDSLYNLPNLIENIHICDSFNDTDENGQIMFMPLEAKRMSEIRYEQKSTEKIRCEKSVELADNKTSVYWCNTNSESALLKKMDKEAIEIIGNQDLDQKEDILKSFSEQEIKRLITKSSITGQGLNWQHCNHSVFFPTFSYEQYYQSLRRFWRFGQKNNVTVDLILSEGQKRVMQALDEKKIKSQTLYDNLIKNINADFNITKEIESAKFIKPMFL